MSQGRSISVTDTAKLIREALKGPQFGGTTFSVRSKSYSGGASITVYWNDGPRAKDVEKVVGHFHGASFDGMVDLTSYHDSVISKPDGTAELVHFGADYVFTSRHLTDYDRWHSVALAMVLSRCECYGPPGQEMFGNDWVQTIAQNIAHDLDFRGGPRALPLQLEASFYRQIYREDKVRVECELGANDLLRWVLKGKDDEDFGLRVGTSVLA